MASFTTTVSRPKVDSATTPATNGVNLSQSSFFSVQAPSTSTPNVNPMNIQLADLEKDNSASAENAKTEALSRVVEETNRAHRRAFNPNMSFFISSEQVAESASRTFTAITGGNGAQYTPVADLDTRQKIWTMTYNQSNVVENPLNTNLFEEKTARSDDTANPLNTSTSMAETSTADATKESTGRTFAVAGKKAGAGKVAKTGGETKSVPFTNTLPKKLEEKLSPQALRVIALTSEEERPSTEARKGNRKLFAEVLSGKRSLVLT